MLVTAPVQPCALLLDWARRRSLVSGVVLEVVASGHGKLFFPM